MTPEDVEIEDIAWGLGRTLRYGGHIREDYTVAHHAVVMSHLVPEQYALEALLHDAGEALLGDIIWPVKKLFPAVEDLDCIVTSTIMTACDCPHDTRIVAPDPLREARLQGTAYVKSDDICRADQALLEHECFGFGRAGVYHPDVESAWLKAANEHEQWWYAPMYAFLERYDQLKGAEHLNLDNLTKRWFPDDVDAGPLEMEATDEQAAELVEILTGSSKQ
jgi:hypothetical protein